MPTLTLQTAWDLRAESKELPNINIGTHVSRSYWNERTDSIVERSEKKQINEPDWTYQYNTGVPLHFRRHNGFRDQERYQRVSRNFVSRQGTFVKYYVSDFNPACDSLYHEDNNRKVSRYFDVPLILSFQPENEIYNRFGIQHLDEYEVHMHMMLFFEINYANLRRMCVEPACDPSEHNPVWYQRGYEGFRYHGYTSEQIFPKAGDLLKIEAFNVLYRIETVQDASPEYQHRWRKYWWKLFLKAAMDEGQTVDEEVLNDPEQEGFINNLLGTQTGTGTTDEFGNVNTWAFDRTCAIEKLKKDVLFHPPEVPPEVDNVSCDPKWYPCGDKFGTW